MKTKIILLLGIAFLALQCKTNEKPQNTESLVEQEWVWLFDGSSTDHWRDTKSDHFPEHGWVLSGDVLTDLGETEDQPGGHDVVTKELFSNFELELEVSLTEGSNSGNLWASANTMTWETSGNWTRDEFFSRDMGTMSHSVRSESEPCKD